MPQKAAYEVCYPRDAFEKAAIQTSMKPKGLKRQPKERHEAVAEGASFETAQVLWRVLL